MAKAKSTTTATAQTTTAPEQVAQTATATASPVEKVSKKSVKSTNATATPAPEQVAQTATATASPVEKKSRSSKKTAESAPSQVAQTATPAPAPEQKADAPVKKKSRSSKKTTESAPAQVAQTATPAPAQQSESHANEHSNSESDSHNENVSVAERITQLVAANEHFANTQREISTLLKKATKLYAKETRELAVANARSQAKKAKREGEEAREPCGIRAPTLISDSMCSFLGCPTGTRLPRTDVTKLVTDYIKKNNLQIQTNKRFFAPDNKLGAILGPLQQKDKEMGYGYFNLQRYLSPHFLKTSSSSVAVSSQ
jgi:chromatin remodeling complex protein RSC6